MNIQPVLNSINNFNTDFDEFNNDEDYDAINDETFGGGISTFNDNDDLEEFANRTAKLHLCEPSSSNWNTIVDNKEKVTDRDKNSCSAVMLEDIEYEFLHKQSQDKPFLTTSQLFNISSSINVEELENQMLLEASKQTNFKSQAPFAPPNIISNIFFSDKLTKPVRNTFLAQCLTKPPPNLILQNNELNLCNKNRNQKVLRFAQNNRYNRPKGLPSNRTISDFAFDPYAGFMSKKEREWLIKIHLIQCSGTGDPIDDDFYYSMWKKRNVLKKAPVTSTIKVHPQYYSFDDTHSSSAYVPPLFLGTLGKPTHCSAKIPRQVIDLMKENDDNEDDIDNLVINNMQKKLKTMLMLIENVALILTECKCLEKQLLSNTISNSHVKANLNQKKKVMLLSVCSFETLPTLMLIQKGRSILFEILDFCEHEEMFKVFKLMIECLPKYEKRIPENSMFYCLKRFNYFFSLLSKQQLLCALNAFNLGSQQSIAKNKVFIYVLIMFLISLINYKVSTKEISTSILLKWLNSNSTEFNDTVLNVQELKDLFKIEDLNLLSSWLKMNVYNKGSIAELLSIYLTNLSKVNF